MINLFSILLAFALFSAVTNAAETIPAPQELRKSSIRWGPCQSACADGYFSCIRPSPGSTRRCLYRYQSCFKRCDCQDNCLKSYEQCRIRQASCWFCRPVSCSSTLCSCARKCDTRFDPAAQNATS